MRVVCSIAVARVKSSKPFADNKSAVGLSLNCGIKGRSRLGGLSLFLGNLGKPFLRFSAARYNLGERLDQSVGLGRLLARVCVSLIRFSAVAGLRCFRSHRPQCLAVLRD